MNRYYYDLHIHSCLSPCADNDNTPCNIAGMAMLSGLNIVALTDHNTCKNCPAFFGAAKQYGLVAVAGMELTTAEDIHIICLFPTLEGAMEFDTAVQNRRILIENRTDIFGDQLIMSDGDEIIGTEPYLLSNATSVSVDEVKQFVESYGGICYPAHIDREANGIISTLGTLPPTPVFSAVEFKDRENIKAYTEKYDLFGKRTVVCSDAHYLTDIHDKENFFELNDEPYSSDKIRHELIKFLRG